MGSLFDFLPFAQTKPDTMGEFIDHAARTPQSQIVMGVAILTLFRVGIYFWQKDIAPHQRMGAYRVAQFLNEVFDALIYAGIFVFLVIRPYFIQAFKIPSGSMVSTLLVSDYIVANKMIYRYTDPKEGDIVVFRPPIEAIQGEQVKTQVDPDGQVNVDFIKRCIGAPGDVIEIKDNILYRNGTVVNEPYKHYTRAIDQDNQVFREETADEQRMETPLSFKLVMYHGQAWPVNISPGGIVNPSDGHEGYPTAPKFQVTSPTMNSELLKAPAIPVPKGYYLMLGDNRNGSFDSRGWGLVPRDEIVGRAEFIWLPISRFGKINSGKS